MKPTVSKASFQELRAFLLLWATQAFSGLGSAMTSFALVVWSYQQQGSALTTALLSVCSYAPYVALSIFSGALSDRWDKKRTMLACDAAAAAGTLAVLLLGGALVDGALEPLMAAQAPGSPLARLLGTGKGAGAALLFLLLAALGTATCLLFRRDRRIWALEQPDAKTP